MDLRLLLRRFSPQLDIPSALLAVAVSAVVLRVSRVLLHRPSPLVYWIPRPAGITGFLFAHFLAIRREEFAAPQKRYLEQAVKDMGPERPVFGFELYSGLGRVVICHPADLEHVLVEAPHIYVKGKEYDALAQIIGKENLVTIRDEKVHAVQRKIVAPAFSPGTLQRIADSILAEQIERTLQAVDRQLQEAPGPIRLDHPFDEIALNTVAAAAFKQVNYAESDVRKEFRTVMSRSGLTLWDAIPFVQRFSPATRQRRAAMQRIRQAGFRIADQVRQQLSGHSNPNEDDETLIEHLVREPRISSSGLVDHIVTFLLAGHETTSRGLLWCAYLLASNPACQEALAEELSNAFGLHTIPTLAVVRDLPYLNRVIKETLRLYPPVGIVVRNCRQDDVLPGTKTFVRKGETVVCHIFLAHRLKSVYGEDADAFQPDRWAPEHGLEDRVGRCGWVPFLAGKRNCIGKDFAWNELLITVAAVVRRYRLSLPEGFPVPKRQLRISLRPKEPIPFTLTARTE